MRMGRWRIRVWLELRDQFEGNGESEGDLEWEGLLAARIL
jgi:hypothetical protein